MTGQQAVTLIDRLLDRGQQRKLNDIQSTIVWQIWAGDTYRSIATQLSYDLDYIKQVAARLWKLLSKLLGENICKSNIKSVLERCQESMPIADWDKSMLGSLAGSLGNSSGSVQDIPHSDRLETDLQTIATWKISDRIAIAFFRPATNNKTSQSIEFDAPPERYQQQVQAQKIQSLIWQSLDKSVSINMLMDEILSVLTVKHPGKNAINCLIVNCYF